LTNAEVGALQSLVDLGELVDLVGNSVGRASRQPRVADGLECQPLGNVRELMRQLHR